MKKTIAIIALAALGYTAEAQTKSSDQQVKEAYFYIQNGKLMVNDWGHVQEMNREMTIRDNTKVTATGFVVYSDGKTYQLKEGERINEDGKISPMPTAGLAQPTKAAEK